MSRNEVRIRGSFVKPQARAAMDRLQRDRLVFEASDPAIGPAFEHAKQAIRSVPRAEEHNISSADIAWSGLAALAIGEVDDGARALDDLARRDESGPVATALELWLLSSFAAWTGDAEAVRHRLPRGHHAWSRFEASGDSGDDILLIVPALRALAFAADCAGDSRLAADLTARAGHAPSVAAIASHLLNHEGARLASADAQLVLTSVYDCLGLEPDAPRHRIAWRPRLPDPWSDMHVRNLAIGDARLALLYSRSGANLRFAIEQTAGAMPLRIVFEPRLPGLAVRTTLDGRPIDLELRSAGNRHVASLQFDAASERVAEFRLAEE